jgi:hypothetical protein
MKLRKKAKYEIESYKKMIGLRKESVSILKVLRETYYRDHIKKQLHAIEQKQFEISFEATLKEKGLISTTNKVKIDKFQPLDMSQIMPFHIPENKLINQPFADLFDDEGELETEKPHKMEPPSPKSGETEVIIPAP